MINNRSNQSSAYISLSASAISTPLQKVFKSSLEAKDIALDSHTCLLKSNKLLI